MVAYDYYEAGASPTGLSSATGIAVGDIITSRLPNKPFMWTENGYLDASNTVDWQAVSGLPAEQRVATAGLVYWMAPWGPEVGNANNASLVTQVGRTNCLTLDKMSGVYG